MASRDRKIQPAEFEPRSGAGGHDSPESLRAKDKQNPAWMVPALLILAVLAMAVIFLLPGQIPERQPSPAAQRTPSADSESPAVVPSPPGPTAVEESSPWAEAQQARIRKAAQDVLADLLRAQQELERRNAASWTGESLQQARRKAERGDELYRSREFENAEAAYRDALADMQALLDSVPDRLDKLTAQLKHALEEGDLPAARQALAMAREMAPDNPDLDPLAQRVEKAPELTGLLEQALAAEKAGDLAEADNLLKKATALDPDHQRAAAESQRVADALSDRRFNTAMSEGYAALDKGGFDDARAAFDRAGRIRSDSSEVTSALHELESARTASRLARLRDRGRAAEEEERWKEAVEAYRQAQEIDSSLVFAREGLQRAQPRADLEQRLQETLERPRRLSDPEIAQQADRLLARARDAEPRGPRLADQLQRLAQMLQRAREPVNITLASDSQTEVTVLKVARLGEFDEKDLQLRPGDYTAVGVRRGYRDVRKQFTVDPDEPPQTIHIVCTEPI